MAFDAVSFADIASPRDRSEFSAHLHMSGTYNISPKVVGEKLQLDILDSYSWNKNITIFLLY